MTQSSLGVPSGSPISLVAPLRGDVEVKPRQRGFKTPLAHCVRHCLGRVETRPRSPFARENALTHRKTQRTAHCADAQELRFATLKGAAREWGGRYPPHHPLRGSLLGRQGPPQSPSRLPALLSRRSSQSTGLLSRIAPLHPEGVGSDLTPYGGKVARRSRDEWGGTF